MSTSDTPLTDGDAESTKRAYGHNGVLCTSTHARDLERQLNAARAELAEREGFYEKMWNDFVSLQRGDAKQIAIDAAKYRRLCEPQPSGEEQPNNGDVVLTHGDLSSARELGDTEKVNAGSSPAALPLSNDEQARFEAVYGSQPKFSALSDFPHSPENTFNEIDAFDLTDRFWHAERTAWLAAVAAHQPQGAPVAHVINTGSEWSALIQENLPDGTKLFTADQWSQSPCQHLSTSKEGTSYCTLAESNARDATEFRADAFEKIIDAYVEDYVLVQDDGFYTPTETEQLLIKDAIIGLMSDPDWDAEWGRHIDKLVSNEKAFSPAGPMEPLGADDVIAAHREKSCD